MRELEVKSAADRKKLMQAIFHYLGRLGVKANLIQEPVFDSLGVTIMESVIQLKEQRIDSLRLIREGNLGCGSKGDVLRFQYNLRLDKELKTESIPELKARTKTVKEGKVLGLFGGKIVDVKWAGQELADILNQDTEISKVLLHCTQIWGEMELNIDAVSLSEICISGPWFVNPNTIIALYSPGKSYEEQSCVFGYKTIDRIAEIIQDRVLNIKFEKQKERSVIH